MIVPPADVRPCRVHIYCTLLYCIYRLIKSLCAPDDYSTKTRKNRWPSQNTFGMWTVLYWTRSSRILFGVSINVCRLAGTLWTLLVTLCVVIIRDFLITLCIHFYTMYYFNAIKTWITNIVRGAVYSDMTVIVMLYFSLSVTVSALPRISLTLNMSESNITAYINNSFTFFKSAYYV
jgi:hypothetical protein